MKRNTVTAFFSIAGGRIAVILVSFLVTPALVRALTKAEYGAYGVVMAVFGLLMILVSSGINSGVRKFLAEERDGHEDWAGEVFGFYFRVALALAVVPAAVFALAAYTGVIGRLEMFGRSFEPYFYLLAVLTLAAQFREYVRRALMGLELEHISEPIKVLHKVVFGVSAVSLAYLGFGVQGVLVGEILASGLAFLVAFYFIQQEISLTHVLKPARSSFPRRELFNFNYLTVVYIFLLTSMYHVDVLMVNDIVNSQTAGVYKGALVIVQFLWLVPRSVQSVLIQSTSGLWADGDIERVNEMASKATRYTLLFTLLLAIGLGALASDFVPLYLDDKYAGAVLPVLLLLPGTLGFAVARPIFAISHAKGELRVVIAATGASAVLNLVLNALLIPQYGMVGAAVATSIGYGSLPFFHYWGAQRIGYDPFADARLGRIALTGVLAGVPTVALALAIETSLLALVVVPPVGFVLYATFALVTGALDVEEVLSVLIALPAPIGPRARAFRTNLKRAPDHLRPFARSRFGGLLTKLLVVVALVGLIAGVAVAVGVEDPDISVSPDVPSTPTPTAVPTATGTATPAPTTSPGATDVPTSSPPASATDTPPPGTPTDAGTASGTPTPTRGTDRATSTATPTPTATATAGTTPTPTDAETSTPSPTATDAPTATATPEPTAEPTATATASPSPTPTATPSATPTASPTATPTATPSATPTATPTPTATATPSATPTATLTPTATATPSATPTPTPTATPSATATPTATPSGTTNTTAATLGLPWSTLGVVLEWLWLLGGVGLVAVGRRR